MNHLRTAKLCRTAHNTAKDAAMPTDSPKPRTRWGSGRIAVAAKWQEMQPELTARWPLTMIYEKHMTGSGISYSQFRRQVNRLIAEATMTDAPTQGNPNATSTSRKAFHGHKGDANPDLIRKLTSGGS
jgi:hypothetical protein